MKDYLLQDIPKWGMRRLQVTAAANGVSQSNSLSRNILVDQLIAKAHKEDIVMPDVVVADDTFLDTAHKWLTRKQKRGGLWYPAIFPVLRKSEVVAKPLDGFNGETVLGYLTKLRTIDRHFVITITVQALRDMAYREAKPISFPDKNAWRNWVDGRIERHIQAMLQLNKTGAFVQPAFAGNKKEFRIFGLWHRELGIQCDTMRDLINLKLLWRPVHRDMETNCRIVSIADMMLDGLTVGQMIEDIINIAVPNVTGRVTKKAIKRYVQLLTKFSEDLTPVEFYEKLTDGCIMLDTPIDVQFTALFNAERIGLAKGRYGHSKGMTLLHKLWHIDLELGDIPADCLKLKPRGQITSSHLLLVQPPLNKSEVTLNMQLMRALPTSVGMEILEKSGWVAALEQRKELLASGKFNDYRKLAGHVDETGYLNCVRDGLMDTELSYFGNIAIAMDLYNTFHNRSVPGHAFLANPDPGLMPGCVATPDGRRQKMLGYRFPILHDFGPGMYQVVGVGRAVNPIDFNFKCQGDYDGDPFYLTPIKLSASANKLKDINDTSYQMWIDGRMPEMQTEKYDADTSFDSQLEFCQYILGSASIGMMDALHSRAITVEKQQYESTDYWTADGIARRAKRARAIEKLIDQRKHRIVGGLGYEGLKEEAEQFLNCSLKCSGEWRMNTFFIGNRAIKRLRSLIRERINAVENCLYNYPQLNIPNLLSGEGDYIDWISVSPNFRPWFWGGDPKDIRMQTKYVTDVSLLVWQSQFKDLINSKDTVIGKLASLVPQHPIKLHKVGMVWKILSECMVNAFGKDKTVIKLTKAGTDDYGVVYEIADSSQLGWLNNKMVLSFERKWKAIFRAGLSVGEQQFWLNKLFSREQPLWFWLTLVLRQLSMGSYQPLIGRHGRNEWAKASQLGIRKLLPARLCFSPSFMLDSLLPVVAKLMERVIASDSYLPSADELNQPVFGSNRAELYCNGAS